MELNGIKKEIMKTTIENLITLNNLAIPQNWEYSLYLMNGFSSIECAYPTHDAMGKFMGRQWKVWRIEHKEKSIAEIEDFLIEQIASRITYHKMKKNPKK